MYWVRKRFCGFQLNLCFWGGSDGIFTDCCQLLHRKARGTLLAQKENRLFPVRAFLSLPGRAQGGEGLAGSITVSEGDAPRCCCTGRAPPCGHKMQGVAESGRKKFPALGSASGVAGEAGLCAAIGARGVPPGGDPDFARCFSPEAASVVSSPGGSVTSPVISFTQKKESSGFFSCSN